MTLSHRAAFGMLYEGLVPIAAPDLERVRARIASATTIAKGHDLLTDAAVASGGTEQITVTFARLRLTYNELQQRPVAHTEKTLANEYLARNRGNLVEYQQGIRASGGRQRRLADPGALLGRASLLTIC